MGQKQEVAHREGRTVFHMMVKPPPIEPTKSKLGVPLHVLKWADDNSKIGGWLERGTWFHRHGRMPILSLTLEERKTCPASCPLWRGCYGDNVPFGHRYEAGIDLMQALEVDLLYLSAAFPAYAVRLHVLGDFYSRHYCEFWGRMLREHEPLHVYGYTHRQPGTDIGDAVTAMVLEHTERCSILRSDPVEHHMYVHLTDTEQEARDRVQKDYPGRAVLFIEPLKEGKWHVVLGDVLPAAVVVPHDTTAAPTGFVICPNEQGRTKSCGTCGLCMNGRTSVAFLDHSNAVVRMRRAKVAL